MRAATKSQRTASQKCSGRIDRADATARSLVVKEKGVEITFFVASDAQILAGARAEGFSALRSGYPVTVTYQDDGGRLRANRIEIRREKTAAVPKPQSSVRH